MVGGSPATKRLKTKATETFGIDNFLVFALEKSRGQFGPEWSGLHETGGQLLHFVRLLKQAPVQVPVSVQQEALDAWKPFVALSAPHRHCHAENALNVPPGIGDGPSG
eukprot:1447699-Alexandrium_andersonii.AAC.1